MKAWTVLGVVHDGEIICWDCMTERERIVANDEATDDEITPLFASDEGADEETCSRCGECLWEDA